MNTIKIFLASSAELENDRREFEIFIGRKNITLQPQGIFLQLIIWENFIDAISQTRLQDEYNKKIQAADIFVIVFFTKVGMYTSEEFDKALEQFKKANKPLIYTYFKNSDIKFGNLNRTDANSVWDFQDKLKQLGHFQTVYENTAELKNHFNEQLDELFIKNPPIKKQNQQTPKCLSAGQPSVPPSFIGRETELADIKQKLEKNKLLLIQAEGGMGKTTLAAKYLNDNINSYNHFAWLFCENGINEQIKTLALPLKVDFNLYKEEDEQLLALKTAMQNLGSDCLLILDNANTPKHIEDFQSKFGGLPWHILLTSRCQHVLPKENEIYLDHLNVEQAKILFKKNQDENTSEFEILLDKFLKAIGYNTLMIELFSKNLHELSALGEILADAVKQFEEKGLFLGERSFEVKTDWTNNTHKEAATTDQIIEALYDLTTLEETERKLLVNLALLPAENHPVNLLLEILTPANTIDFAKQLRKLAQKGWLASDVKKYRMNPVVQQIALSKNKTTVWDDIETMVTNLNYKLKNDGYFLINLKGYAEAQPFADIAESVIRFGYEERFTTGVLLANLSDYYKAIGNTTASLSQLEKATNIFKEINDENYVICLQRLGAFYQNQGYFEKALEFFEKSNMLKIKSFENNPESDIVKHGLAISYQRLGIIYEKQDHLEKALELFEKDKKLKEELFEENPNNQIIKHGLSISYNRLGNVYEKQGNIEKALIFFNQDIKLSKELFEQNPQSETIKSGLATSYQKLGIIYEKQTNFEKALEFYNEDNKLSKELFKQNPQSVEIYHSLAYSHFKLGNIYIKMQKSELGKVYLKMAEKIWLELTEKVPSIVEYKKNLIEVQEDLNTQ